MRLRSARASQSLDETITSLLSKSPSGFRAVPPPAWSADYEVCREFTWCLRPRARWGWVRLWRFNGGFDLYVGKRCLCVRWRALRRKAGVTR